MPLPGAFSNCGREWGKSMPTSRETKSIIRWVRSGSIHAGRAISRWPISTPRSDVFRRLTIAILFGVFARPIHAGDAGDLKAGGDVAAGVVADGEVADGEVAVDHATGEQAAGGQAAGHAVAEESESTALGNRFPPDRLVDFTHLKLELEFDDFIKKSFRATATHTLRAIAAGGRRVRFDAVRLNIIAITVNGESTSRFSYDGKQLVVETPDDLPTDRDTVIAIEYECIAPVEGMHFVLPDETYPHRRPQIHTLGQPEYNRHWLPCHDFPNERATTEMLITVPRGFSVLSNGELVERRDVGETTVFHWRQDSAHVAYLISLVVGSFAVVEDTWRGIPVTYWVQPGKEEDARRALGRTPEMMTFFSDLLDYAYPYAQYAQACVHQFQLGGMEHTSATTLYDQLVFDKRAAIDHDQEGLIAHELVHQWFGDLITCRSWEHVWLNEGFATFFDDVWYEHSKGHDQGSYDRWFKFRDVAGLGREGDTDPLLWRRYEHPRETFQHGDYLPYGKGSSLLHMLRHQLGQEVFIRGIREYVRRFAGREVETNDFRGVMEWVAGRNLELFFADWAYRPGAPRLSVDYEWDDESRSAVVKIEQTQDIDENRPAFAMPLDLYFRSAGEELTVTVDVFRRKETFRRRFDDPPDLFCVDPQAGVLKTLECRKPRPMWLGQLRQGPTVASRCEAAAQLKHWDRPEVVEALGESLADAGEFWGVRAQSAYALGSMQSHRALRTLLDALVADGALSGAENSKVRAAAARALGFYRSSEVTATLVRLAEQDESYAVEAAATRAIGSAGRREALSTLAANVNKESYQDQIRKAAVWALGELGEAGGVESCMRVAGYGHHDRTRPIAIEALGKLALLGHDTEAIESLLIRLLHDPERRAQVAAVEVLGKLGTTTGISYLAAFAQLHPRWEMRRASWEALLGVAEWGDGRKIAEIVRTQIRALRGRQEALEKRFGRWDKPLDRNGD